MRSISRGCVLGTLLTLSFATVSFAAASSEGCPLDDQLRLRPGLDWTVATARLAIAKCKSPALTVVRRSASGEWSGTCQAHGQDLSKAARWRGCAAPPVCTAEEEVVKRANGQLRLEAWKKKCMGRKATVPPDDDPKRSVPIQTIDTIVVHETELRQSFGPHELQQAHLERGFDDIGYHYVIARTRTGWRVFEGRSENVEGAHAGSGLNGGTLGIAIAGDYRAQSNPGEPEDSLVPPPEAVMLLKALVSDLRARHPTIAALYGHGEYKRKYSGCDTDCPSLGIQRLVDALRAPR